VVLGLRADFNDYGEVGEPLDTNLAEAERTLNAAAEAGLDLVALTAELEREGVESFCASYRELLDCIEIKLTRLKSGAGADR